MRWTDCRIVAFDTETTGLNPFDGDRIIELGAVQLKLGPDGRVVDVKSFGTFVNPEIPIPRTATKVSGITDDQVADAPVFAEVAKAFCDFLGGAILVAHNLTSTRISSGRSCGAWASTGRARGRRSTPCPSPNACCPNSKGTSWR